MPEYKRYATGIRLTVHLSLLVLLWTCRHDAFFWDTVQLASKHAHFFYENHLVFKPLPLEIDSGHPPLLGYYLALCWSIFGKSLTVSHWCMAPFVLGIGEGLIRLVLLHKNPYYAVWLLPLFLLDPVVAGQMILVAPDVLLLCFFLWAWLGISSNKPVITAIMVLGLCLTSMRGMMTAAALGLFYVYYHRKNIHIRMVSSFIPGAVAGCIFLWWHWRVLGWVGYHPASSWAPAFEKVDMAGFLRNVMVYAWRWLDFGRLFEWFVLGIFVVHSIRKKNKQWNNELLNLCVFLMVVLSPSALVYRNLSAHRYFLPMFAVFHIFILDILSKMSGKMRSGLALLVVLGLASGNFWRYPAGISMDWDSTLLQIPYHRMFPEVLAYMEKNGIDVAETGTVFPAKNRLDNLLLNGNEKQFADFNPDQNRFMFASNVMNDLNKAELSQLATKKVVFRKTIAGVWVALYENKPKSLD